jgi:hypothetical protein
LGSESGIAAWWVSKVLRLAFDEPVALASGQCLKIPLLGQSRICPFRKTAGRAKPNKDPSGRPLLHCLKRVHSGPGQTHQELQPSRYALRRSRSHPAGNSNRCSARWRPRTPDIAARSTCDELRAAGFLAHRACQPQTPSRR